MSEVIPFPRSKQPPKPAESTVSAFWYLIRVGDPERLRVWLRQHRADAPALLQLLDCEQ
jgi:hypothetical protein